MGNPPRRTKATGPNRDCLDRPWTRALMRWQRYQYSQQHRDASLQTYLQMCSSLVTPVDLWPLWLLTKMTFTLVLSTTLHSLANGISLLICLEVPTDLPRPVFEDLRTRRGTLRPGGRRRGCRSARTTASETAITSETSERTRYGDTTGSFFVCDY